MRGISLRIDRAEALRLLGAKIRQDSQEFEKAKRALPKQTENVRALLLSALRKAEQDIKAAKTLDDLKELAGKDLLQWEKRKDLPVTPQLSLCNVKNHLDMLKLDTRKVIPINSNSYLWSLLEGKCEVIRG